MFDKIKSSAAFKRFKEAMQPFLDFIKKFLRDWSLNFAGMLAYSLLVALVPMIVTYFGIIGFVLRDYPNALQTLTVQIANLVPNGTLTQVATKKVINLALVELTEEAGALFAIGLIFSIFGASRFFAAVDKTLTVIYRIPQRSFTYRNLVALGMVFVFLILFTLIIAATFASSIVKNFMKDNGTHVGICIAGISCTLLVTFSLFELIYWLIPNRKMPFKFTWCGALIAACLFEMVILWFPIYVENNMNSYTGVAGFALFFILLLYYFSLILILGAQINAHCFEDYHPYEKGIGNVLSQAYNQHIDDDPRTPLINENKDIRSLQYQ